jgi:hypothetical protein
MRVLELALVLGLFHLLAVPEPLNQAIADLDADLDAGRDAYFRR